jgi:predicted transposase YdaD
VKTASEKLLKEQAKNMVMTEEELDYLASLKVRARAEGHAEGRSEGKNEGHADAINVFASLGVSPEKIAEAKAMLDTLNSSK